MLIPDCRGLDQNFHDVTIVDMGEFAGVAYLHAGNDRLDAQVAAGSDKSHDVVATRTGGDA